MVRVGLLVRFVAKPGKEKAVSDFLAGALPLAHDEAGTTAWFALHLGEREFGIFDAFPDERSRHAHLAGPIAAALMAKASELFEAPPRIEEVDVLAAKLT